MQSWKCKDLLIGVENEVGVETIYHHENTHCTYSSMQFFQTKDDGKNKKEKKDKTENGQVLE